MKNKLSIFFALAVLSLAILACSSSDDAVVVNTPAESSASEAAPQVTNTISQPGTARSNPAPVGSEVVVDDMAFQILSVVDPANDLVTAGNMFNPTPAPDQKYIFIELKVTCKKSMDEQCSYTPLFTTTIIGSSGVDHDPEYLSGVESMLETTSFYGDASITGYIPFLVGVDETNLLLTYSPLLGNKFYLALPE